MKTLALTDLQPRRLSRSKSPRSPRERHERSFSSVYSKMMSQKCY